MEKTYQYITKGTCSRAIIVTVDDDTVKNVEFIGGCSGNTQGISKLVCGMKASEAIKRLRGIRCGMKSTSCPDQLSYALEQAIK